MFSQTIEMLPGPHLCDLHLIPQQCPTIPQCPNKGIVWPGAEGDLREGPEGSQTSHLGPNWASLPTLNSTAIPINLFTIFGIVNGNISNCRFHHDPLRKFMAQRDSFRRKSRKNPVSASAMLTGKFLQIRRVFATSSLLAEEYPDTLQYKISR